MADEPEEVQPLEKLIPPAVRKAYAAEMMRIAHKTAVRKQGNLAIDALQLLPYIGDAMATQRIDIASACSDDNREYRTELIVKEIEKELGELDDQTKKHIRLDVEAMYSAKTDD